MIQMELAGVKFALDPAAISALRYRAEYGESVVNALAGCGTPAQQEGVLVRLCRLMLPQPERPELLEFAALCRRDGDFFRKGQLARAALLDRDPTMPPAGEDAVGRAFDEYDLLALMAAAGLDFALVYELPLLHLVSVVNRHGALLDPERKEYRPMTQEEKLTLYPRRKRGQKEG